MYRLKKYNEAIKEFDKAIKVCSEGSGNKEYAEAYFNKGMCYVEMEKFKKGSKMFKKCMGLNSKDKNAKEMFEYCNQCS